MNTSELDQDVKILYVDDERENLDGFSLVFLPHYDVYVADNAKEGLEILEQEAESENPIRLVITDQRMPEMTGIEFLEQVTKGYPDIVKILITGYSDIEVVTQAINKVRIYKYVAKPWDKNELKQTIDLALEHYQLKQQNEQLLADLQQVNGELEKSNSELKGALGEVEALKNKLEVENIYLREEIAVNHNFKEIITQSRKFKKVLKSVESVAKTDATVLVLGETGTGKELVARAVHNASNRATRPLIKVNCASLPANLIESELFGHEKGAFTGALNKKIGRFELADGGTMFLDEIGEMPMELQAKLLRVLQEGEFERLGSTKTIKVNVRLIAATNRNLQAEIENGNFRQDLYFRLNVFPVELPPLRERNEDIPLLVEHFVVKFASKMGKRIESIPQRTLVKLQAYKWPGNIRELENVIERAVITSPGNQLVVDEWFNQDDEMELEGESLARDKFPSLEENERQHIIRAIKITKGTINGEEGAATLLQMNPSTLRSRMQKLTIEYDKSTGQVK